MGAQAIASGAVQSIVRLGQLSPHGVAVMAYLSFNPSFNKDLKFAHEDKDNAELEKTAPLKYKWTLWEQMQPAQGQQANYTDATRKVDSFGSVQDFWKIWGGMPQPSQLLEQKRMVRETAQGQEVVDAIMLFRDNIKPEWEDQVNAKGGHFQFQLKPNLGGGQIDEYWNNLVLGALG